MLSTLALLAALAAAAGPAPPSSLNDPELRAEHAPSAVDARLRQLLQLRPPETLSDARIKTALEQQFPEGMARAAFEKKLLKGLALEFKGQKANPPMSFYASADNKSSCWVSASGANCLLSNSKKESDESGVVRQYKLYFSLSAQKQALRSALIDQQSHYCTTGRRPSVQCMSRARQLCEKRGDRWREVADDRHGFIYGCEASGKNRNLDH